jgi:signal transduction histidine kinase
LSDAVGEAVVQLDSEIAGLRALITELRPAALDQLGLHAGIAALAERTRRDGLEVDVSIDLADAPERLAPDLETAIYRVVQEALTNARKHGGAERSVVEVHEDVATVGVTVRDDGDGFDATAGTEGFGLLGMRERVSLLGGTFEIESAIGRETVVHATFPVRRVSGALPGPVAAPRLIDAAES